MIDVSLLSKAEQFGLAYERVKAMACSTCGMVDVGQTGEYPCPKCGLPTVWDGQDADGEGGEAYTVANFVEWSLAMAPLFLEKSVGD